MGKKKQSSEKTVKRGRCPECHEPGNSLEGSPVVVCPDHGTWVDVWTDEIPAPSLAIAAAHTAAFMACAEFVNGVADFAFNTDMPAGTTSEHRRTLVWQFSLVAREVVATQLRTEILEAYRQGIKDAQLRAVR